MTNWDGELASRAASREAEKQRQAEERVTAAQRRRDAQALLAWAAKRLAAGPTSPRTVHLRCEWEAQERQLVRESFLWRPRLEVTRPVRRDRSLGVLQGWPVMLRAQDKLNPFEEAEGIEPRPAEWALLTTDAQLLATGYIAEVQPTITLHVLDAKDSPTVSPVDALFYRDAVLAAVEQYCRLV